MEAAEAKTAVDRNTIATAHIIEEDMPHSNTTTTNNNSSSSRLGATSTRTTPGSL